MINMSNDRHVANISFFIHNFTDLINREVYLLIKIFYQCYLDTM